MENGSKDIMMDNNPCLLKGGHVDVIVGEERVRILEQDPVQLLVVRPLQQLGHLGAVRPPPDSAIPRDVINIV
jgi:hypothetical protein